MIPRPRRRSLARFLLGAALAIAGVVVPLEAPALPDSPVQAQDPPSTPVIAGTAESCPSPYQPSGSNGALCILETTACRDAPASLGGGPMQPSVQLPEIVDVNMRRTAGYPDFCEARYLEKDDEAGYAACRNTANTLGLIVRWHVMEEAVDGDGNPELDDQGDPVLLHLCRIIHPATCTSGAQVGPYECRSVRRRTWSCSDGYRPRNDFNSCYRPLSRLDRHPACGAGAPTLVALDCADYVGTDYALSPAAVKCADFDTGSAASRLQVNAGNKYWCRFDASYLKVACHADPRPAAGCPSAPASCLKRASETGGCNAIAHTIRCRGLQALLTDGQRTVEQIRDEGCQPCVLLPFDPRPASCPADTRGQPSVPSAVQESRLHGIHVAKASFEESVRPGGPRSPNVCGGAYQGEGLEACLAASKVCQSPPSGRLTWSSTHHSSFAVVNLPVILTVRDVPSESEEIVGYSGGSRVSRSARSYLKYPVEGSGAIVQQFSALDPALSHTGVEGLANKPGHICRYRGQPLFRVVVEELWPAGDEQAIKELFGEDSLDWWNALSTTERENLTAARGDTRSVEIPCNRGEVIWCRWAPTRSGYYSLRAAGAWWASRYYQSVRPVLNPITGPMAQFPAVVTILRNSQRRNDSFLRSLRSPRERQRISDLLTREGLTAADLGLNDDLNDYLPLPSGVDRETVYTSDGPLCPSRDVRFTCAGPGASAHYTLSEPIGIAVHEVRVATRTPNS